MPKKILLQTTIPTSPDDWDIARFARLATVLDEQHTSDGSKVFSVVVRDRNGSAGPDPILSRIDEMDIDALWLFAVDTGNGLSTEDCAAISRFRRQGRGLLVARDHMDLGSSVCTLDGVGLAHNFHSKNLEADPSRHKIDDPFTGYILWPNYHSGANGDFQKVSAVGDIHPVLQDPSRPGKALQFLPSHPHEGAVSAPSDDLSARVIAKGYSAVTGIDFNIAVAFEPNKEHGPAIAQSTFHHFADYNWDTSAGAPSFVSEAPGQGMAQFPEALRSTKAYVRNAALWLCGLPV